MHTHSETIAVEGDLAVSGVWALPDDGGTSPRDTVILAHGAGNDMTSPLLSFIHEGLAGAGLAALKFNFLYTEAGRRAPDPAVRLEATYRAVVDHIREHRRRAPRRLFLGGKSMGGRIGSHLVAQGMDAAGLVFLGYPLHPAGKPERLRTAHLGAINCPMLFIQGSRDPLCRLDLLEEVLSGLRAPHSLHLIEQGDHSFKLPKRQGRPEQDVWREIVEVVARWVDSAA